MTLTIPQKKQIVEQFDNIEIASFIKFALNRIIENGGRIISTLFYEAEKSLIVVYEKEI